MSKTCIRFGKHGARVLIEDKEIQHYGIDFDVENKEVTCWIASEAGKAFSIVWFELDVNYPSACYLFLDGHHAESLMRQSREPGPLTIERGIISDSSSAPFIFSPLVVTTDDDEHLNTIPSPSIGEIKLIIARTSKPKKIAKKRQRTVKPALPHLQKVHEHSKKGGIAHRASYGSESPTPKTNTYSSQNLETLVTFIFRYRPLEILHANDIVPRNPEYLDTPASFKTSSGKGVKREAEFGLEADDSDEDMREQALMAELDKIRKGRNNQSPKKKLKREDKPPLFTPGEIIDLT